MLLRPFGRSGGSGFGNRHLPNRPQLVCRDLQVTTRYHNRYVGDASIQDRKRASGQGLVEFQSFQ